MKQKVNVTIDGEIMIWIKKNAKKNHLSFSTMINQILWEKKDFEEEKNDKEIIKMISEH